MFIDVFLWSGGDITTEKKKQNFHCLLLLEVIANQKPKHTVDGRNPKHTVDGRNPKQPPAMYKTPQKKTG